jgi:hypothetical protein
MFVSTLGCFGCATGDVALEDAIPVESPELDAPTLDLGRFHVPEAMRTAFLRTSPGLLTLDASEGRFLLELGEEPLRFADDAALRAHLVELGATPGADGGLELRTEQRGEVHWWDETERALYRVTDPVAASIGGIYGVALVGDREVCFDSDGECDGLASYLEPAMTPSAPTHDRSCSGGFCVEHHSFYNNVFGYWFRSGGNSRITSGDPQGTLDIRECAPGSTLDPSTLVDTLTFHIRTGGDDLRGGSDNATAILVLRDGRRFTTPLNRGESWPNNSLRSVSWSVRSSVGRSITIGEIARVGLSTNFRGGIDGENWNVDQIAVGFSAGRTSGTLFAHAGAPFLRFTGAFHEWTSAVLTDRPSSTSPVSRLHVTLRTGGDDLRGGNDNVHGRAVVSGRTSTEIMLNAGAMRWADGSTHTAVVPVPSGTNFGNLRGLDLRTTFGGGWNGDNWNLDELLVEAESGGRRFTVFHQTRSPLVRFTASDSRFSVTFPAPGGPRLCATRRPPVDLSVRLTLLATREGVTPPGVREVLPQDFGEVSSRGEAFVEHAVFSVFAGNTGAPEGAINTAIGICSFHRGPTGDARTGNGDQRGFCD